MRNNRFIALCIGFFVATAVIAQPYRFYPLPKMTKAVQQLKDELKLFKPKATLEPLDNLPTSVDNSKLKYFPPIISQQGGSCAQASGIGYMFTYEINRLLDRDASESKENQLSYQFAWNLLNDGEDAGGFVEEGLNLAKNYGIMTVQDYGLSGSFQFKWANGYEKYVNAMRYRAQEVYTFADSVPLMKRYLYDAGDGSAAGGVLSFSGQSSWTIDNNYNGPSETGYRSLLTKLGTSGSHAVTLVGYDDLVEYTDENNVKHKGAFIVVNSWGTHNHDEGRFYLPYDFFRDPNVSNLVLSNSVIGVKTCIHEPKVVAKITVNYSSRDDLYFGLAFGDEAKTEAAGRFHYIQAFNQKGGDHPMQGQYLSREIEFALDFTPYLDSINAKPGAYFLNVVRGYHGSQKGEGSVVDFSVVDYRGSEPVVYAGNADFPVALKDGRNIFIVKGKPSIVSASPYRYSDASGNIVPQTILLRTATGRKAKLRFTNSDPQKKTIDINFQINK